MEQLNLKTELGNIYYKYNIETDDFDILRVIAIQNAETVRCIKNGNMSDSTKISVDELKKNYTRLLSDGVVSLSNVKQFLKDFSSLSIFSHGRGRWRVPGVAEDTQSLYAVILFYFIYF